MNRNDIERILRLQNSAYELLLWLNKRAENEQELLSDHNLEQWRHGESCENWVRETSGMIPQAIRPSQEDIPAFARLFSSFFLTSFRLTERAPVVSYDYYGHESGYVGSGKRRLMAGAPSGKKSAKGKVKVEESARELRIIALEELALENDLLLSRADLEALEQDDNLHDALVLWTYFHELNRRANFASQGDAVRSLWQAMDKKEREKMSVEKIVNARDSLITALNSRG
ncbi:MAG TPA: hypothetical protein VF681_00080 [Abditibacteriaceae bacterium]|jgi:hypothetical protein